MNDVIYYYYEGLVYKAGCPYGPRVYRYNKWQCTTVCSFCDEDRISEEDALLKILLQETK